MENIKEIEAKAKELLNSTLILNENTYNTTIDAFYEHFEGLDSFLKSMRPKGYFGMSPQEQNDLDQQQEMINRLQEIKEFVELNYQKNKDLINK